MNIGSMFLRKKSTSAGPGKADAGAACEGAGAADMDPLRPRAARKTAAAIVTHAAHPRGTWMTRCPVAMIPALSGDVRSRRIDPVQRQNRGADPRRARARLDLGDDLTRLEVDREGVVRPGDRDVHVLAVGSRRDPVGGRTHL